MWKIIQIDVLYSSDKTYNFARPIAINTILLQQEDTVISIQVKDDTIMVGKMVHGITVFDSENTGVEIHHIVDCVTVDITDVSIVANELPDETLTHFETFITDLTTGHGKQHPKLMDCGMWILIHVLTKILTKKDFENNKIKEKILDRVLDYFVRDLNTRINVLPTRKDWIEELDNYLNWDCDCDDPSWQIADDPWGDNNISFKCIKNDDPKNIAQDVRKVIRLLHKRYPNIDIDTYYGSPNGYFVGWFIVVGI